MYISSHDEQNNVAITRKLNVIEIDSNNLCFFFFFLYIKCIKLTERFLITDNRQFHATRHQNIIIVLFYIKLVRVFTKYKCIINVFFSLQFLQWLKTSFEGNIFRQVLRSLRFTKSSCMHTNGFMVIIVERHNVNIIH